MLLKEKALAAKSQKGFTQLQKFRFIVSALTLRVLIRCEAVRDVDHLSQEQCAYIKQLVDKVIERIPMSKVVHLDKKSFKKVCKNVIKELHEAYSCQQLSAAVQNQDQKLATMLSKMEKSLIKGIWERLTPVAEDIGSDALLRMFNSYPGTKTYFSHLDISPGSSHLHSHGKKIVLAIAEGAKDISQLTVTLAPLQTLHAYQLRIDPTNFKLLSHCMLVSLACYLGEEFTPVAHAAMDKYLSAFAAVLSEKYR